MAILWTLQHAGRLPTMTLQSLSYVLPTRGDLVETGKLVCRVTKNASVDEATFHRTWSTRSATTQFHVKGASTPAESVSRNVPSDSSVSQKSLFIYFQDKVYRHL